MLFGTGYTVKKRLVVFPSPAGLSLTMVGDIPAAMSLTMVSDVLAGDGKTANRREIIL
jgi:hypothetical protein